MWVSVYEYVCVDRKMEQRGCACAHVKERESAIYERRR